MPVLIIRQWMFIARNFPLEVILVWMVQCVILRLFHFTIDILYDNNESKVKWEALQFFDTCSLSSFI